MDTNLEKQEFLERFTKESKASKILAKRIKKESVLEESKSRFVGSRIQEYFDTKRQEKDMLTRKKEVLQRSIAELLLVKQNHAQIMGKVKNQTQEIRNRIKQLKIELGDQVNLPLSSKIRKQIKELSEKLSKKRSKSNKMIKNKLKEIREKTKNEILGDPEYEMTTEINLKEDIESNIYPSNIEFSRYYKTDSEIRLLRHFPEKNIILYVGKDSYLRVIDWKSLRILGLIRVNTSKPIMSVLLNKTSTDTGNKV